MNKTGLKLLEILEFHNDLPINKTLFKCLRDAIIDYKFGFEDMGIDLPHGFFDIKIFRFDEDNKVSFSYYYAHDVYENVTPIELIEWLENYAINVLKLDTLLTKNLDPKFMLDSYNALNMGIFLTKLTPNLRTKISDITYTKTLCTVSFKDSNNMAITVGFNHKNEWNSYSIYTDKPTWKPVSLNDIERIVELITAFYTY